MCSACSGDYEDPDILIDAAEEPECQHTQVTWNGYRSLFICQACGAHLVIPELAEALGYVSTE